MCVHTEKGCLFTAVGHTRVGRGWTMIKSWAGAGKRGCHRPAVWDASGGYREVYRAAKPLGLSVPEWIEMLHQGQGEASFTAKNSWTEKSPIICWGAARVRHGQTRWPHAKCEKPEGLSRSLLLLQAWCSASKALILAFYSTVFLVY